MPTEQDLIDRRIAQQPTTKFLRLQIGGMLPIVRGKIRDARASAAAGLPTIPSYVLDAADAALGAIDRWELDERG